MQNDQRDPLSRRIQAREQRKLRARQRKTDGVWVGIGTFGMVGWSIAIPTLIGIALGIWLDAQFPQRFSWTLTLLVGGVLLGCINTWYWIDREQRAIARAERSDDELE